MLPIRDTIRSRSFPLVTWMLIALNALVFFLELGMGPAELDALISGFGLVPARLSVFNPFTWLPLLTHMFLHGGWVHFLGNVWTLAIFGDNVEDRLGSGRFLLFYLIGGVAAGLIQSWSTPNSLIPSIGASGAIAAVMGAYFFYYPRARVITLVPLFVLPWFVEIPALIYLGFWFVSQLFSGLLSLAAAQGMQMGGIAWWAHIGGFLFGLLLAGPLQARQKKPAWYQDEYYPW
ncbi:peptidase S54 [Ornatilinea apprima]|uniref:Peptidase S54 n=1 Tax=Ornatilinea apprima TaxID=1134406 RepID=A0A0P6X4I2_9CHLR|nr:rhomboid family intramembrane serine protease [Ornatilinea apprima]KPL76512.1 peptidase S54 [Ornatilinea apprima]